MAKPDTPTSLPYGDYAEEWAKIDSLEKQGLLKSALELAEALYARAKAEQNTPQIIKALLYRGKYITELQEDGFERTIALFEQEEKAASEPERSVLQSLLGELYSIYLQNIAWRTEDRTPLAEGQPGDIKIWSAAEIELQALHYYRSSVARVDVLRATPADHLKALLTKPLNDSVDGVPLRPTLFDILAHRALKHFSDERSYLTQPVHKFYLDQPEAFAPAAEFVRFEFASQDTTSGEWLAIRLFQQVLAVHLASGNTAALIDADLLRLQFARNKSTLSDKWERYAEALRLMSREYYNHPSEAEIAYHLGVAYQQLSEQPENAQSNLLQQAVAECESAMARHPNTYGAALCRSLVQQIRRPSIQVQVEQVYLPEKPSLMSVLFKNIQQVHARLVALPAIQAVRNNRLGLNELLTYPVLEQRVWSLNAPEDFREHRTELRLPPLPIGHYAVLVSPTGDFNSREQPVSYAFFACSNLASIPFDQNGVMQVAVVHRETGAPLAGVLGEFFEQKWDLQMRDYREERIGQSFTGKDGLLRPQLGTNRMFFVRLSQGKDTLWLEQGFYRYLRESNRSRREVVFFTDRSLYRPGQTVYFKGILLERDSRDLPRILPGVKVKVSFYDANMQPKGHLSLASNEYGTFNGAFQAPTSGLMGVMSIRAEGYIGQASFSVEEYKRPKFEVTFRPIEGSYRVGDIIKVRGVTKNYAGNSVDGAQVRYRVVRQAYMPWWWHWRDWPLFDAGEEVEIASGATQTAADGSFEVVFTALPDRKLPEKGLPIFRYTVKADVTDITGETRSNETTVSAGYVALNVDFGLPEEVELQDLRKVILKTTNNAGQAQYAKGTIEITRLASPQTRFVKRYWPAPDVLVLNERDFRREFPLYAWNDEDNPEKWSRQGLTRTISFRSSGSIELDLHEGQMTPGYYEVVLKTRDAFEKPIEIKRVVRVWDAKTPATRFDKPAGALEKNTYEPGETARLWLGGGRVLYFLVFVGREGKILEPRWLQVSGAQSADFVVQEADRGGIGLNAFTVQHNRFYQTGPHTVVVPWSNKELTIAFETFRDRLAPGDRETWRLRISGPKKEKVAAEVVAAMYDASLDQFLPHGWNKIGFPSHYHALSLSSEGFGLRSGNVRFEHSEAFMLEQRKYAEIDWFNFPRYNGKYVREGLFMMRAEPLSAPRNGAIPQMQTIDGVPVEARKLTDIPAKPAEGKKPAESVPTPIRRNLNETVFFLPELRTDAQGNVLLQFTVNEALTRWKLLLFAHTKELQQALEERTVVTQKELMVLPNPPRFLREGDVLEFTAKVSNLSEELISGTATLSLFDAVTMQSVETVFGLHPNATVVPFTVAPGRSALVSWRLKVPEGQASALTWQIFAEGKQHRDGEENTLPVVTNRMLVTETLPLPVRGKQRKTFSFESLKNNTSKTLRNHRYTVEFTSNPVWYAVQALPYLMEFPYECTEQIFSRFYANALAAHVMQKLPNLRRVYDRWKATGSAAMQSNLTKNQELKTALLEETPWVLEAMSEEQQKQNIALLFDLNRMADERERALNLLVERQEPSGGWSWFPGGRENWFITQHIVAGLGHLKHLGVLNIGQDREIGHMLDRALAFCHKEIQRQYAELEKLAQEGKVKLDEDHLHGLAIHYLYATSFFAPDRTDRVTAYYLEQSARYWLRRSLCEQGMIALALYRYGRKDAAQSIVASLRERAIVKEELGMYWSFDRGMYWYQLPIETQALLIEVFSEVANDVRAVEELRIWLLKNKQTNRWESTKATAEAIYALLLRGDNWLASTQPIRLQIGSKVVSSKEYESGTGYFKQTWSSGEIQPDWSTVRVENPNPYIVWGAAYWQYFEDLDKIAAFRNTPLTLVKQIFREENTATGPKLYPISNGSVLKPGDRLKVRIEIRTDRAMEFVHLKDTRAAGFEPVNVLSRYRWQDGLGYYESTRDLATHFFIDYLPRGTFVLEYPLVVTYRGDFSSGIATLQCMYAPEFSSHSQSVRVKVE
ncbi:MAG: MG2 domain-containing protein [Saprospiraceae bacterium]|nr:MG2 domain-containing protein [Saprospiraceae bacterium]MDW8485134.1 MG2 domain-containing protein [Saprospiraceae bacterium]